MLPADLKGLYEAYNEVYENVDLITDDLIEEVVEELIQECVEFGYELDEAADIVEGAAIEYLMELNPYAPAGSKEARAYQKSTTSTKRGVERRAAVTAAKEKVKAKAKGAVAAAGIAGSIAKDELRRVGRAAAHTVTHNVQKKKAEVKSGVKSLLGKGLRKAAGAVGKVASKAAGAASRLGEEAIQEDSRRMSNRQKTASVRQNIRSFGSNFTPPNNYDPDANRGQGEVLTRKQIEKKRRKSLRQEDVEFDVFDLVLEYLLETGHAETISEAQYIMTQMDSESIEAIVEETLTEKLAKGTKGVSFSTGRHAGGFDQAMTEKNPKTGRQRKTSPLHKAWGAHSKAKQKQWDAEKAGDHEAAARHKKRRDTIAHVVYNKTNRIIDRADND